jgi:hypothetical protein
MFRHKSPNTENDSRDGGISLSEVQLSSSYEVWLQEAWLETPLDAPDCGCAPSFCKKTVSATRAAREHELLT